uniref:Guanylate cyclase domain-containing protein n=1 Tax=Globisporangium ultimum (strain ATCC 200006 / CBS 805.95 / DAOM BR144) TaxID=431595 RepID=K3X8K4_GLOUD
MREWSLLYACSLLASCVASVVLATSIYRQSELRVSAVRCIFFFFFFYLGLWSLFRGVFYVDVFLMDDATFSRQFQESAGGADYDNSTAALDALGVRGVAEITNLTRPWLSFILLMGDTCLMASSLWMFPMTWELSALARKSMDRGALRERLTARWYCKWMHVLTVLFFLGEAGYTMYNHGVNTRAYRLVVSGNMLQLVVLVYVTVVLVSLKWSGRKYETINGEQVASPLYRRLKGIMIVYGVFSFQYTIVSLMLLGSHFDKLKMPPTLVVGTSTLLFNNSGTAVAIAIGCSQECFFRAFHRYVPEEYAEAFYVSDPSLWLHAAGTSRNPPLQNPVFVYTDIEASTQLWGIEDGAIMKRANEIHEQIVRVSLAEFRGYEITTCGDAFQLAFHTIQDAVDFCTHVQFQLLNAAWPKQLHDLIPATRREKTRKKKLFFNGLRLRMGVHDAQQADGVLVNNTHPVTGKVMYTGLSEVIANEIGDVGGGGQICVTARIAEWIQVYGSQALHVPCEVELVGQHLIPQLQLSIDVYQVIPRGLEPRKETYREHWNARLEAIKVVE